jgi:hypothetical protein
VAQTLQWAADAARRGDLRDALAWMEMIDAIGEGLPEGWEEKRRAWRSTLELESNGPPLPGDSNGVLPSPTTAS